MATPDLERTMHDPNEFAGRPNRSAERLRRQQQQQWPSQVRYANSLHQRSRNFTLHWTSLMAMRKFFVSHAALTLFVLTVLTWGPLLYNTDGIYWDDWVLVTQPVDQVGRLFLALGAWFSALMHVTLLSVGNGIVGYRVACFLATAVIAITTFEILLRTGFFRRADALLVAAVALVFPVCSARVALINAPQQVYLALFMIAWNLSLLNFEARAPLKRATAVFLFFVSLSYMSLMWFYLLPLGHLLWLTIRSEPDKSLASIWRMGLRWVRANIDFVAVPFLTIAAAAATKSLPANYAGYNTIHLKGFFVGLWLSVKSLWFSFVVPIQTSFPKILIAALVLLGAVAVIQNFRKPMRLLDERSEPTSIAVILLGLAVFFMGIYPYCVVEKLPTSADWGSRLQILVPLGAAILFFGLIRAISIGKRSILLTLAVCSIAAFGWADLRSLYDFRVDWTKQLAIVKHLSAMDATRASPGGAFTFVDNSPELNANRRTYRFYELSGFLRREFGDQSRLGTLPSECAVRKTYKNFKGEMYNIDGYDGGGFAGVITIDRARPAETMLESAASLVSKALRPGSSEPGSGEPDLVHLHLSSDQSQIPSDCRKE
jgi:hypothetical protein